MNINKLKIFDAFSRLFNKNLILIRISFLVIATIAMLSLMKDHGIVLSQYYNETLLIDFGIWAIACSSVSAILYLFNTKNKKTLLIFAIVFYLASGVGWQQTVAVLYFSISAYALGRLFIYYLSNTVTDAPLLMESIIIGIGCYVFIFGILIHFPVNYYGVYIVILSIPIAASLLLKSISFYKAKLFGNYQKLTQQKPDISYWILTISIIITGYVARYAFFPSVNYDDHATHLRFWTLLANRHMYDFDIFSQIWAAAPFIVDLLHAILSLISQDDARGAMNLGLLAAIIYSMSKILQYINLKSDVQLLAISLFVTTPMTSFLLTSLQAELLLATLSTIGVTILLKKHIDINIKITSIIMVSALCCGIKLPGLILATVLFGLLIFVIAKPEEKSAPRCKLNIVKILFTMLIAIFVAFHSYFIAWNLTGNPTFPLYNEIFKSSLIPIQNFKDIRYSNSISLKTYIDIFLNTGKYFESANYTAGFQYLFLLPLGFITILGLKKTRFGLFILAPVFFFGLIVFLNMQYWRYLFPIMPLASILIGAIFLEKDNTIKKTAYYASCTVTLIMTAVMNLYFLNGISHYFTIPTQTAYSPEPRKNLISKLAPEQHLNNLLNQYAPKSKVLFEFNRPYGSTLIERPLYINWYNHHRNEKFKGIKSPKDLTDFIESEEVDYIYWDLSILFDINDTYRMLLRQYLNEFGQPVFGAGSIIAYKVKNIKITYEELLSINNFNEYKKLAEEKKDNQVLQTGELLVGTMPTEVKQFDTKKASSIRFNVSLQCPTKEANFIAQINWEYADPYYRLVACNQDFINFSESFPVPANAKKGYLYLTAHNKSPVKVNSVRIEAN